MGLLGSGGVTCLHFRRAWGSVASPGRFFDSAINPLSLNGGGGGAEAFLEGPRVVRVPPPHQGLHGVRERPAVLLGDGALPRRPGRAAHACEMRGRGSRAAARRCRARRPPSRLRTTPSAGGGRESPAAAPSISVWARPGYRPGPGAPSRGAAPCTGPPGTGPPCGPAPSPSARPTAREAGTPHGSSRSPRSPRPPRGRRPCRAPRPRRRVPLMGPASAPAECPAAQAVMRSAARPWCTSWGVSRPRPA